MDATVARRRRWNSTLTIAVVVAASVHLAGFALFAVRTPDATPVENPPATISLLSTDRKDEDPQLREYLELTDQKRLFRASTRGEVADAVRDQGRRVPGDAFDQFQPEMTYSTTALPPLVSAPRLAPETPLTALRTGDRGQFSEFGREDGPEVKREPVSGLLTVRSLRDGTLVFRERLTGEPTVPLTQQDWAPAEFSILVSAEGVVGAPVLAKSSTAEEVDRFLRGFLSQDAHLGERLAPGFYRVTVSP